MRTEAENIIIRIQDSSGIVGWGETIPRPYVTGETIADTIERYKAIPKSAWKTPLKTIDSLHSILQDTGISAHNAARCGMEIALLDLLSKNAGKSIREFLQESLALKTDKNDPPSFLYGGAIGLAPFGKTLKNALLMRIAGFKSVKLKLEKNLREDRQRVRLTRFILGKKVDLRVDANEAWDREYASQIEPILEACNVTGIEQPFPKDEFDENSVLSSYSTIPIILDESLCTIVDAERAVSAGINVVFCVKLPKTGGFLNALKIFAFAQKQSIPIQVSCQVGETAILSAAGRHLAGLCPTLRYLEGSFDKYLLKENIIDDDISFGYGGRAKMLTQPGLGISLNEEKLASLSVNVIQVYP